MEIYLAIITTVLVATQVIRVTQNAVQLRRQTKSISHLEDVTNQDLRTQKRANELLVEFLESKMCNGDDDE